MRSERTPILKAFTVLHFNKKECNNNYEFIGKNIEKFCLKHSDNIIMFIYNYIIHFYMPPSSSFSHLHGSQLGAGNLLHPIPG